MKLATYVIGQGDTLEILAQKLLGDASQVDTLIQINQLRYPYISDNPIDQYARPKGNVFLNHSYTNATHIQIVNTNNVNIQTGDTLFFQEGNVYAAGVVQKVSGSTITFADALRGTFDQAAIVTVFANQQNVISQVLRTGDTLLYPSDLNENPPYSLLFGSDWALDQDGFLKKENGDIAVVSGTDNLKQAVRLRLTTPYGALMLHNTYGNQLYSILGEAGFSYFKTLAKHYIEECASQDIRIQQATVSGFTQSDDSVIVTLELTPIGMQGTISQPITIPIGGIQ